MTDKGYIGMPMEGRIATWYARNTEKSAEYKETAGRIAAMLPAGSRFLEVAPGPGYLSIALARMGKVEVTGLDISQTFVEIARSKAKQAGVRVDFRQGNASAMPFSDESFDFVYCRAAFKNFSQPVRALAEMYRVLKPGGKALVSDLRRDASTAEIDKHVNTLGMSWLNRIFTKLAFRTMLLKRAYTKPEIEAMLLQAGVPKSKVNPDLIGLEIWLEK